MTSFAINDGYVRLIELGIGWFHFGMNREENSDGAGHDEGCSICSIVKSKSLSSKSGKVQHKSLLVNNSHFIPNFSNCQHN